jgi:hypothetical protein
MTSVVSDEGSAAEVKPQAFSLQQNWPNPFNACTVIPYVLPSQAAVRLAVYDLVGRQVATLIQETQQVGTHLVVWRGTDSQGNPVSSGVYVYRLRAGTLEQARTMTLLR